MKRRSISRMLTTMLSSAMIVAQVGTPMGVLAAEGDDAEFGDRLEAEFEEEYNQEIEDKGEINSYDVKYEDVEAVAAPEDDNPSGNTESSEEEEKSEVIIATSVKGVVGKKTKTDTDFYYYYTASNKPYTGLLGVYGLKTTELIQEGEALIGPNAQYVTWLKHVQQYVKENEVTDNELATYLRDGFTFSDNESLYKKYKAGIIGILSASPDEQWIYVTDGYFDDSKNGFVEYDGGKFFVVKGRLDQTDANGLVNDIDYPKDWYFCANGQVQSNHTGLAEYDGAWFYINKGKLDTTMAAYVEYDGGLFFVGAGRIMKEVSGLAKDPNGTDWYYLAAGQAQIQYTGLAMYDGEWFYVVNGKLAQDYSGPVNYDGSTFNVKNGMVVQGSAVNTEEWFECNVNIHNSKTFEVDRTVRGYMNIPGLHLTSAQSNIFVCLGPVAANTRAYARFGKTLNANQMYIYINATSEPGETIREPLTVYYSFTLDGKEYNNCLPIECWGSIIVYGEEYPHYCTGTKIVDM